jgi:hypothetical protein
MSVKVELYLNLWETATTRPSTHRAGIEYRMRRLWKTMTTAERAELASY